MTENLQASLDLQALETPCPYAFLMSLGCSRISVVAEETLELGEETWFQILTVLPCPHVSHLTPLCQFLCL